MRLLSSTTDSDRGRTSGSRFKSVLCLVLGCLLLGGLLGAVIPASAAPPPRPLCDACGDSFEATADAHGVAVTVEESTATVTVHTNGSATWVVHNHLASSATAERLRSNHTLLTTIGERAMWDTEFLGANVSTDGIVTLRYREPGFATASIGGAFRSGAFTQEYGYRNLDGLGAERLVVVAPPDTQFERTVPGATVSEDGTRMTLTELDEGGFVTFVPSDTRFGPVLSRLAIGLLLAPAMLLNALIYVALPTAVFALLIGALTEVLSWLEWEGDRIAERAGVAIGAIGAVVTALSVLATGGVSVVGGTAAPLFGAGIALIGFGIVFSRAGIREEVSYPRLVGGAALGVLLAAGVTVLGAMSVGQSGLTRSVMSDLPFLIPLFMLLPAGYAYGQEKRRLAVGTAAGGFALSMMFLAPFTSPWFGLGLLLVFLALIYAVGIAVVGAPLFVIAASYASPLSSR